MKKIIVLTLTTATLISNFTLALASDKSDINKIDPNAIVTKNENVNIPKVNIPKNVTFASASLQTASISYNQHHDIVWSQGYRYCWQDCQAYQGSTDINSYSRARFEHAWWQGGSIYGDSGRLWSTLQGRSYAASDWEYFDTLNSGAACTYYGI